MGDRSEPGYPETAMRVYASDPARPRMWDTVIDFAGEEPRVLDPWYHRPTTPAEQGKPKKPKGRCRGCEPIKMQGRSIGKPWIRRWSVKRWRLVYDVDEPGCGCYVPFVRALLWLARHGPIRHDGWIESLEGKVRIAEKIAK